MTTKASTNLDNSEQQPVTLDTITLRGKQIPVKCMSVPHAGLLFYAENPRIYSILNTDGGQPSQEEIYRVLRSRDHVRENLVVSIRNNSGLIEPILIRNNVVLEGNCRLAAYRFLSETDPATWKFIKVRELPASISDSEIFSLLGEYHMVGKQDWAPYEQAGYLFRRHSRHKIPAPDLAIEVGLPVHKVRHLLKVFRFMIEHDQCKPELWSYYDVLLSKRAFKAVRDEHPDFDELIVQKINAEEIQRARDLRDSLPLIIEAGGKVLRSFLDGKRPFADSVEAAEAKGAGNYYLKKFKEFKDLIADDSLIEATTDLQVSERSNFKYVVDKISQRLLSVKKKLD